MAIDIGADARLSPFQAEVWRSNRGRGLGVRHVMLLEGAPAADAIVSAFERVLARHPILRTRCRIDADGATPRPEVESGAGVAVERMDLSAWSPEARREALSRLAPLDALDVPLRIGVARLSDSRQALVLAASALAADAVTLDLIVDEVMRALGSARPPIAPGDALPFAAVAEWQNELQTAPEEAPGRAYWAAEAETVPGARWPFPIRAIPGAESRWNGVPIRVDAATGARLSERAAAAGVPIDVVVEAVWRVLLSRLTGQADVRIGVLVDGRRDAEMQGVIGPVSRVLPMTSRVEAAHDLYAVAQAVARIRDESLDWQDAYPGSAAPLEVGFASLPSRIPAPGQTARVRLIAQTIALLPIPVQLVCRQGRTRPSLTLQYDATRVPEAAMQTLAGQYRTLLANAVATPAAAVKDLGLVSSAERARQLTTFQRGVARSVDPSGQALSLPDDLVHVCIAGRARTDPARLAVVAEDGTLTYAALDHRASQLARHLQSVGVKADLPVGLASDRGLEAVVGMLAILKAGGAFVPLEIRQPRERLLRMLADARITIVLTTSAAAPQLPVSSALQIVAIDGDAMSCDAPTPLAADVAPGNLAYVMFTSGSTGWPKGVAVEHRQLAQYVRAVTERLDLRPSWQYATVSTLAADLGHTMIFGALCSGGTLHVVGADLAADADRLASYLHEARVDCVKIVPSHLQALLTASRPEHVVPAQRLVLGGEAARWSLVRRLAQLRSGCAVYNHYGPTETTVGVVATRLDPEAVPVEAEGDGPVPLGQVLDGVEAFVVDEAGDLAAIGAVGELYLGGATVTRGYVHRPGQTAERYVPDGLSGRRGARLYRTGDLARFRPDGTLEYLGRRDRQVKFHGFRVELDEIRQALQRHPQVRDGYVAVAPDRTGADALVAYYVSRQPIDLGELRRSVAETIPEQTRPSRYIHLTKLPLTPNGKIDVGALPSADDAAPDAAAGIAPRTATEERLAAIWRGVLHLERVSVRDDFFEVGGQSLIATVVIARIRDAFSIDLPFRALFEHRTIEALSARVDQMLRSRETDLGDLDGLVNQLKQLPADEVERLLADARSGGAKVP